MNLHVTWPCAAGLAMVWGLTGCAHEKPEDELPSRRDNLSATLPQDRSKISQYDRKEYRSKQFSTKSYQTSKATVGKRFKAPSRAFNTTAYQTQNYGKKLSPLGAQVSPYADDKARTKGFSEAGKVAPTSAFTGSDKEYSTERASDEGRRFRSAKIKRRNVAAARAQEKSIQASDISLAKLPMSAAGPGAISKVEGTERMGVRPRVLSPYEASPGATLSSEEVRGFLNKGPRPD